MTISLVPGILIPVPRETAEIWTWERLRKLATLSRDYFTRQQQHVENRITETDLISVNLH